jgi:hypothetical protein
MPAQRTDLRSAAEECAYEAEFARIQIIHVAHETGSTWEDVIQSLERALEAAEAAKTEDDA